MKCFVDKVLWVWIVVCFHLIIATLAEHKGTGTSWKRVLSQNDRSFAAPSAQLQKSSLQECAKHCHTVPGSWSLTFQDNSKICKCYDLDYQYSGSYTSDPGSVFMTRNYTVSPSTVSYIPMDGTYTGPGTPCKELYSAGKTVTGVYTVTPEAGVTFNVFCNMTDGGWTVVQYRFNGSVNFTRSWNEYVNGFGSFNGEFWMGLEKLYVLTKTAREVYFHLQKTDETWLHLHYTTFSVTSNATYYKLSVGGYVAGGGIQEQSFIYNNGKEFYTYDRDNGNNCANKRFGGWWYGNCVYLNLNGKYGLYDTESGMTEHYGGYKNLKATVMKIK